MMSVVRLKGEEEITSNIPLNNTFKTTATTSADIFYLSYIKKEFLIRFYIYNYIKKAFLIRIKELNEVWEKIKLAEDEAEKIKKIIKERRKTWYQY